MKKITYNYNMIIIKKILKVAFSYESVMLLVIVILNIINLIIFRKRKNIILINNSVLLIIYFLLTNHTNKRILFISMCLFAIAGLITESFIIYITNKNLLEYKDCNKWLNIPLWLFTIYCIFFLTANYTFTILSNIKL